MCAGHSDWLKFWTEKSFCFIDKVCKDFLLCVLIYISIIYVLTLYIYKYIFALMILGPLYTAYKETFWNAIHYYDSINTSTSILRLQNAYKKSYIFERIYIIPLIDLSFYTSDITLYTSYYICVYLLSLFFLVIYVKWRKANFSKTKIFAF
jgi:hypothetical protein